MIIEVFISEEELRKQACSLLVLIRDMKSYEVITEKDVVTKRLGIGISSKDINKVIEKKLKQDLKEDDILQWEILI